MPTRQCLSCGELTSKPSRHGLCPDCEQARPERAVYDSARWRKLRRRVLTRHIATHGWWCPGWGVPAHPSRQLTIDHGDPLVFGGDPYNEDNLGVLCKACNGRKGARGGSSNSATATVRSTDASNRSRGPSAGPRQPSADSVRIRP